MRTQTLQYLYLQKPVTMIVVICMISVLPWIATGDFSTKGEPREAAVAISMLETGNWILPQVYADEFAYKPPMAHWIMAIFSYPQGYVSEFTARLPSALAFIILMGFTLFFFGERVKFQEAFIATLLLLTCIEIHRAGMTTRVDMLLTMFIVLGLYRLYRWENKLDLKGLPIGIPILFGCAILTKGPVGIILPLFVFGIYLLILNTHSILTIFKALLYIGVSSLFLPLIWYIAAWKQGGDDFLQVVLAENFGRFFHINNPEMHYELGHENGIWYNFVTLIAGFMPWTLFFFFSLFGIKLAKPGLSWKEGIKNIWTKIRSIEKIKLFSLVTFICIFIFYSIPSSKRSVYLMPAYPFIALFLAEYALYLTEYRTKVTRVFAGIVGGVTTLILLAIVLVRTGAINPVQLLTPYIYKENSLAIISSIIEGITSNNILTFLIILLNLLALGTLFYQMSKKINIKILYASIFLVFTLNLMIDGIFMKSVRNAHSAKGFAQEIRQNYPLTGENVYVMNNLREYTNLYGLNFYMGNIFHNFEKQLPSAGWILSTEKDITKITDQYGQTYIFTPEKISETIISEVKQRIILSSFKKR